jgi:Tfp pilus assembly protein PilF
MKRRRISFIGMAAVVLALAGTGCASTQKKIREPLLLSPTAPAAAKEYTVQGRNAYLAGQYDQAKALFMQAVSAAPNSGEAHYNLGLALFKLGETEAAREQFIQAANLAPGNKVIWDSPALSPYGDPEVTLKKQAPVREHSLTKPQFGVLGPR